MLSAAEREATRLGRQDPVWFANQVLRLRTWSVQDEILLSIRDNRTTAVRSCHAAGKSTIAAAAVLWFTSTHPGAIAITTATTHKQVEGILWREIARLHRGARKKLGGHIVSTKWKIRDDWYAWGFTSREYDATRFQGFHAPYIMIVIDEAAGVTPQVFEGLESAMSSGHARMLCIGNPTVPLGDFAEMHRSSTVSKFKIDAFDTPNFRRFKIGIESIRDGSWRTKIVGPLPYPQLISPEWVAEKWQKWCRSSVAGEGDPRWCSRVRGEFPSQSEDSLVPYAWIEEANARWSDRRPEGVAEIGLDVARHGDDATVLSAAIFAKESTWVFPFEKRREQGTMETTGWVKLRREEIGAKTIRVDADGLGAGVFDRLEELREPAVEMRGGMTANEADRFVNARSEWMWSIRESLRPDAPIPLLLPPDDDLVAQATSMRWKLDSRGRISVEAKDDYKARTGMGSPDELDALAYALARGAGKRKPKFLFL